MHLHNEIPALLSLCRRPKSVALVQTKIRTLTKQDDALGL